MGAVLVVCDLFPLAFNPQFLEGLYQPSGAVKLRDKFYIERDADALLKHQVMTWGSMTTIRAPRQTGKSSLLIRGLHHDKPHLINGLKQVMRGDLPDEKLLYRLSSAGLVKGSNHHYTLRCDL